MQITQSGCWEWTACKLKGTGYGKLGIGNKIEYAHRASWVAHKGEIPDGHEVCHKCDNPACINPDHLFTATHKENVEDMVRKDRAQRSKFTVDDADRMANMHADGLSQRVIAEHYGISQSQVSLMLLRKLRLQPSKDINHVA